MKWSGCHCRHRFRLHLCHRCRVYDSTLSREREKEICVCEVWILCGRFMWLLCLPKSFVYTNTLTHFQIQNTNNSKPNIERKKRRQNNSGKKLICKFNAFLQRAREKNNNRKIVRSAPETTFFVQFSFAKTPN